MPEAPAPMPVLSRTTMRVPLRATVTPRAARLWARCIAVDKPCTPAPMIAYVAWGGRMAMSAMIPQIAEGEPARCDGDRRGALRVAQLRKPPREVGGPFVERVLRVR